MILRLTFFNPVWLAVVVAGLALAPAGARPANAAEIPDAQALIDGCWEISLEKRSTPTTAIIREGILDTVLCLENVVVDQFRLYNPRLSLPRDNDPKTTTIDKVGKKLEELRFSAGGLYWWIFTDNPGCDPTCGTMKHTFHLSENARILERMIRIMIEQRKEYRF